MIASFYQLFSKKRFPFYPIEIVGMIEVLHTFAAEQRQAAPFLGRQSEVAGWGITSNHHSDL
jgi:hypothetical protein